MGLMAFLRTVLSAVLFFRSQGQKTERPFDVVWNSPTKWCQTKYGIELPVTDYGIKENTNSAWKGNEIVLFYEAELGLYPWLTLDEKAHNGGLPQLGDLQAHLVKATEDIKRYIPDKDFSGYAVIDWENWRPIWQRNWGNMGRYQRHSRDIVKKEHPDWNQTQIEDEARSQFESAARLYMEGTLKLARDLRPKGKWGFYGFPACYNHKAEDICSDKVMAQNDQLSWLFKASNALYPTAYIRDGTKHPRNFVYGHNNDAIRARSLFMEPDTPILLYTRYQIDDGRFYSKEDFDNSLQLSMDQGLHGAILWGSSFSSNNKTKCEELRGFLLEMLGPYVKGVIQMSQSCSLDRCYGNGRCLKKDPLGAQVLYYGGVNVSPEDSTEPNPRDDETTVVKENVSDRNSETRADEYIEDSLYVLSRGSPRIYKPMLKKSFNDGYFCQCFPGWMGDKCDIPDRQ